MNRRSFLKLFGGATAVAAVTPTYFFAPTGGWVKSQGGVFMPHPGESILPATTAKRFRDALPRAGEYVVDEERTFHFNEADAGRPIKITYQYSVDNGLNFYDLRPTALAMYPSGKLPRKLKLNPSYCGETIPIVLGQRRPCA